MKKICSSPHENPEEYKMKFLWISLLYSSRVALMREDEKHTGLLNMTKTIFWLYDLNQRIHKFILLLIL